MVYLYIISRGTLLLGFSSSSSWLLVYLCMYKIYHLLIEDNIWTLFEEEFTSLNVRSFRGRGGRLNIFVDALANNEPIPLTNSKSAIIKSVKVQRKGKEEQEFKDLSTQKDELKDVLKDLNSGDRLYLVEADNVEHSITAVIKTSELGGKGKGYQRGTGAENIEISNIQKQIDELGKGEGVTILIGDRYYYNVVKIEKVPGFKKADFRFIDSKNIPVIFIQHKSPQHQQMSGIGVEPVKSFSEITDFAKEVFDLVQKAPEKRLAKPYYKLIQDSDLKRYATYGVLDKEGNGVQVYSVGTMKLESVEEGVFKIVSSGGSYIAPEKLPAEEEPILVATYRSGRNQRVPGTEDTILDTRIGIYPKSYISGS